MSIFCLVEVIMLTELHKSVQFCVSYDTDNGGSVFIGFTVMGVNNKWSSEKHCCVPNAHKIHC